MTTNFEKIKVLVLAGGFSTRLWPFREKHFLKFLGKPLILHSLEKLIRVGFKDFIIVCNQENKTHFEMLFRQFLQNVRVKCIEQGKIPGMGGALLAAKREIENYPILVFGPSDVVESAIFSDFQRLLKDNPDGIISGKQMKEYFPGGYLEVEEGKVVKIKEKPKLGEKRSDIVTFVFDYFKNASFLISAIEEIGKEKEDRFEQAIDLLVRRGFIFRLLQYNGFWGYLKYPWHILDIMNYFLGKISSKRVEEDVFIASTAEIKGEVYLAERVKILEHAKVIGPAYIGKETIIGNNSLVRESMVGERCVVGFSTELARSYIGSNCWFHSNYIGDSIIGDNVSLGAGTILANFRLDEGMIWSKVKGEKISTGKVKLGGIIGENVRIGVGVSVMPGIKIGSNSVIGPGIVLDNDLSENRYCRLAKRNYEVKKNKFFLSQDSRKRERKNLKF